MQVRWDTYATAVRTTAPPSHLFYGLAVILFRVYLHIGYEMNRTHY